jgi:hypothetical protein
MKLRFEEILFLSLAFCLVFISFNIQGQTALISDADEEWTADISPVDSDLFDSSDAKYKLPNEAVVCHADEIWTYEFEPLAEGVTDSSDAKFNLPNEAVICHADEIWTNELTETDFSLPEPTLSKTPVLFVPGLLGTDIKQVMTPEFLGITGPMADQMAGSGMVMISGFKDS